MRLITAGHAAAKEADLHSQRMTPVRLVSSIVCLARTRQGCPKDQKALRAGYSFGGSTVDWRGRDEGLHS
jgi:hypothetical protein